MKSNSLNFKIVSDQDVEIDATNEDISADGAWIDPLDLKGSAKFVENVEREERDLPFVIFFVVEVAIAPKTLSRDTFQRQHFDRRKVVGFAPMMADKIVPGRDVKMTDFHRWNGIINVKLMKGDGIGPGQIIRRRADGGLEYQRDELTIEEPLEIRIGDRTVATTMRTPGHDEELAAGFLLSEAIVRAADKIARFLRPDTARNRQNIIAAEIGTSPKLKLGAIQRFGTISTSCGLCGKESIDAMRQNFAPIGSISFRIEIRTLLSLPDALRKHQSDFSRTGGIHAAGIFNAVGEPMVVREDIGRHNAVD